MITEIIGLIGLTDYGFLGYFIGAVLFAYLCSSALGLFAEIFRWIGGRR